MILNLNEIDFVNDFFSISTPDGNQLILNKIDESLTISSRASNAVLEINNINIELRKRDDSFVKCPCVIGMGNEYIHIDTEYKEDFEGAVLTSDNMKYCTINVYE